MQLLINCFPIEIAPQEFGLPCITVADWDKSTDEITRRLAGFTVARAKKDDGSIGIFLIEGSAVPVDSGSILVGGGAFPNIVSEVALTSLATHFRTRGLAVQQDNFEVHVTTPAAQFSAGTVELRTGLAMRVRFPPGEQKSSLRLLMARWEVKSDFNSNLDNPDLLSICTGKPVLYRPQNASRHEGDVPPHFVGRYLGHVISAPSGNLKVSCRDRVERTVPAKDLRLEATPATVSDYERATQNPQRTTRSVWHKVQELSYVLTTSGRRNASVLRDRMDAIRRFLGQQSSQALLLPSPSFADVKLSLGLVPTSAEIATNV